MKRQGYCDYRESGVEWIGEIPHHWSTHRLKWSITGCSNGVWGDEPDGIDDVVCVRVADFDRAALTVVLDSPTFRAVDAKQLESRKLERGDLLIEKSGGGDKQLVGCVVQFNSDADAVCSNFVARMPVVQGQSARYWCYVHAALYSGRLNYPAIKQSTGIQNLDAAVYLDTVAPYPPKDEQEQIADFLDWKTGQIDALIANKRELIDKLKEQRLALITRTVTNGLNSEVNFRDSGISWLGAIPEHWEAPALKMRYSIELGKMLDEKKFTRQELIPYLRNVDVQWSAINYVDLPEMDVSEEEYLRYSVKDGDLLVCEGGEVGRAAIVSDITHVTGYQKALHRLRPENENEAPKFMLYTLFMAANSGLFGAESSSTIAHLTAEQLRRYKFPRPPFEEQEAIVIFLDKEIEGISRVHFNAEAVIEKLIEIRSALITAATTGKIDVRTIKLPAAA